MPDRRAHLGENQHEEEKIKNTYHIGRERGDPLFFLFTDRGMTMNKYELEKRDVVGYVYLLSWTENRPNRPFYGCRLYYVGQHKNYNDRLGYEELVLDGYYGSGKIIGSFKRQFDFNREDLKEEIDKEILEYPIYGQENLDEAEREYIREYHDLYGDFLVNLEEGGTKDECDRKYLKKNN